MTDYTTCKLRDGTYLVVRTLDLATGHYHEVANVVGKTMAERIAKLLNRDQLGLDLAARIQADEALTLKVKDHDDLPASKDLSPVRILGRGGEGAS